MSNLPIPYSPKAIVDALEYDIRSTTPGRYVCVLRACHVAEELRTFFEGRVDFLPLVAAALNRSLRHIGKEGIESSEFRFLFREYLAYFGKEDYPFPSAEPGQLVDVAA